VVRCLHEFGKKCEIVGFKDVEIADTEGLLDAIKRERLADAEIQFFDADLVATWEHICFAALNSLLAFENGKNISKSPAMETMLYASARSQIRKATEFLGIKPSSSNVAILVLTRKPENVQCALTKISACIGGQRDDSVLELSRTKIQKIRKAFEVSEEELETTTAWPNVEKALIDLVLERVALVAAQR